MPTLLRKEALRLLEAGIETYILALCGATLPSLRPQRVPESRYAPAVGLVGTSVELLVKACLVHGYGPQVMKKEDGFFKFGSESIEEFRSAIRLAAPELDFLWSGTPEPTIVRDTLFDCACKFRLLQDLRAGGLHAGIGPSRDVLQLVINDVYIFVTTLGMNRRLKPYLRGIPEPDQPVVKRAALLEDLSRRLAAARDLGEKADLLRAIYLVLPSVPENEPAWLKVFDRITVVPDEKDVTYLLATLTDAHGMHLFRQRGNGEGIPFKVVKDDPHAIPMSVEFLKREFTKIPEQFHGDIANANGRLNSGILDLPPEDFILDLFGVGVQSTTIYTGEDFALTAQQAWPYVASALSVSGTPRPCWYIVKLCNEHEKLKQFLFRAAKLGNPYLKGNVNEAVSGIDLINQGRPWPDDHPVVREVRAHVDHANTTHDHLGETLARASRGKRRPCTAVAEGLARVEEGCLSVGELLQLALHEEDNEVARKYWAGKLAESTYSYHDRAGLVTVLRSDDLAPAWTAARKALRVIDILRFGPSIAGLPRNPD